MYKLFGVFISITVSLILFNLQLTADELQQSIKPFTAKYKLYHKSDAVGEALIQLEYLESDIAKYSYKTDASWLIFSDKRLEYSELNIIDKTLLPSHYFFHRKGTGKNKKQDWQYDIKNNKATDAKKNTTIDVEFPSLIQDKLSYQLQLRLDLINNPQQKIFSYPVISTSGTIKNYTFESLGEENIELPFGSVKAIKLKREVTKNKKVTYAWFAPEMNFLLVKLKQLKKGKSQFNVELKSIASD